MARSASADQRHEPEPGSVIAILGTDTEQPALNAPAMAAGESDAAPTPNDGAAPGMGIMPPNAPAPLPRTIRFESAPAAPRLNPALPANAICDGVIRIVCDSGSEFWVITRNRRVGSLCSMSAMYGSDDVCRRCFCCVVCKSDDLNAERSPSESLISCA
jgi:hypothetical protein